MFNFRQSKNQIVYANTYSSDKDIFIDDEATEDYSPGSFMVFDNMEFETIESFIKYVIMILGAKFGTPIDYNIIRDDEELGSFVIFKNNINRIEITIPPKPEKMDIVRDHLGFVYYRYNTLMQSTYITKFSHLNFFIVGD